ncbi:hypothetical protein RUND412_004589 [Rhizina undulata]
MSSSVWYLPPNSTKEDRITAMEIRLNSLISYQSEERNKRQAQWLSEEEKIAESNIELDELIEKIEQLEAAPNGRNSPQYPELNTQKEELNRQINEMPRKIAAEKRKYEKKVESSPESEIIHILQRMIEIEKRRAAQGAEGS